MKRRAVCFSALALALAIPHAQVLAADADASAKERPSLFSLDRGRLLVQQQSMELRWDLSSPVASLSYDGRIEQLPVKPIDPKSSSVLADKTLIVLDGRSAVGTEASEPCSSESQAVTAAMGAVGVMCQQPSSLGCVEAREILSNAASNYSACIVRFYQQEK